MILCDTDVCIELLRGNRNVIERRTRVAERISVSFVTVGELYYGSEKSGNTRKNQILIEEFLLSVGIINSSNSIMRKFGELRARLESRGSGLPDADIMIAATCVVQCEKLITGNVKHFDRIDGLRIENWLR